MESELYTERQMDVARLAAFIDGEGCLIISPIRKGKNRKRPSHSFRLLVTNTDARLMAWLKTTFGGFVNVQRPAKDKPNWNLCYHWQVMGKIGESLLKECLPFLILKKEQALVILRFRATVVHGSNYVSDELFASRQAMIKELDSLKPAAVLRNRRAQDRSDAFAIN